MKPEEVNTLFLSDLHLGSRASRATALLVALNRLAPNRIYLVGDVIDFWRLRNKFYWPKTHNKVVRKIFKMAERGVEVIYIPGNHDDLMRDHIGLNLGGVAVRSDDIYTTLRGEKILIVHGDEYDWIVSHNKLAAQLGGTLYEGLITTNLLYNKARRQLGMKPHSLADSAKRNTKRFVNFSGRYERALVDAARLRNCHSVLCGHIHMPAVRSYGNITYYNTGDWVDSCSYIVEDVTGRMELRGTGWY